MRVETAALVAILGMALVTYGTRLGGLWLMNRVTLSPRVEAWLGAIPGAVLVAIVAPEVLAGGLAGALAATVTILVAARSRSVALAMVAGVGAVLAARTFLP